MPQACGNHPTANSNLPASWPHPLFDLFGSGVMHFSGQVARQQTQSRLHCMSRLQVSKFSDMPRFGWDGTSRPDRIPNCERYSCTCTPGSSTSTCTWRPRSLLYPHGHWGHAPALPLLPLSLLAPHLTLGNLTPATHSSCSHQPHPGGPAPGGLPRESGCKCEVGACLWGHTMVTPPVPRVEV